MIFDLTVGNSGDIATSRQLIREIVQGYGWSNVFAIRAIAALTAIAEVLYFGQKNHLTGPLRLSLKVIDNMGERGIEYYAQTDFQEICKNDLAARWHLERVSSELDIHHGAEGDYIVMKLYMESSL